MPSKPEPAFEQMTPELAQERPSGLFARFRHFGRLGPISLFTLGLPAVAGVLLLGFMDPVGEWLKGMGSLGLALFVVGTAVLGALSILPTAMLCLLGGWTFGFATGMPASVVGILTATLLGFALARWVAGDRLLVAIHDLPRARAIHGAFTPGSFLKNSVVVMLLRVSPVVPFAFTNLVMAASRIGFWSFLAGTVVGLLPRSAALTYIGASVNSLRDTHPDERWLTIAGIIATLVALVLLALMARRAVRRISNGAGQAQASDGSE